MPDDPLTSIGGRSADDEVIFPRNGGHGGETPVRTYQQWHFARNEYLLIVQHERGWLRGIGPDELADAFFALLAAKEYEPILPRGFVAARPVRLTTGGVWPQLTVFRVQWPGGQSVGEVIDAFNRYRAGGDARELLTTPDGKAYLWKAIPNWYMGAENHSSVGTHGPVTEPEPVADAAAITPIVFPAGAAQSPAGGEAAAPPQALDAPASAETDVFILDNLPPKLSTNRIEDAWDEWGGKASFARFEPIVKPYTFDGPAADPAKLATLDHYETKQACYIYAEPGAFDHLDYDHTPILFGCEKMIEQAKAQGLQVRTLENLRIDDASDHGFFIAGIIHELAPNAALYVIEVLDQYGVGMFSNLIDGFEKVQKLRQPDHNTIINISFVLSFPTGDHCGYTPNADGVVAAIFAGWIEFLEATGGDDLLTESIELLQLIQDAVLSVDGVGNTVIVACVGNDSARPATPKAIRYPAALTLQPRYADAIVAVGALKTLASASAAVSAADYAPYSNDVPASGLLAFGGDSDPAGDRVISIFSMKDFIDGSRNNTGFARWAGTSFAAPIAASKLVELCRTTGKSPVSALSELRSGRAAIGQPRKIVVDR